MKTMFCACACVFLYLAANQESVNKNGRKQYNHMAAVRVVCRRPIPVATHEVDNPSSRRRRAL